MGYKYHIQDVLDVAPSISELLASERGISIKTGQGCKCPLHNDTNPSFHLYEDTQRGQTFACFGCHRGGDVITFWQYLKGHSKYKLALDDLGERYGAKPASPGQPGDGVVIAERRHRLMKVLGDIHRISAALVNTSKGLLHKFPDLREHIEAGREMCKDHYGWSDETLASGLLGYFPREPRFWRFMATYFGWTMEDLLLTGAFSLKEEGDPDDEDEVWKTMGLPLGGRLIFWYLGPNGAPEYAAGRIIYRLRSDGSEAHVKPSWGNLVRDPKTGDVTDCKMKFVKLLTHSEKRPYIAPELKQGLMTTPANNETGTPKAWEGMKDGTLVVAEGAPDLVSCSQLGLAAVSFVTTGGSKKYQDKEMKRVARYYRQVVFVFDDEANGRGGMGALETAGKLTAQGMPALIGQLERGNRDKIDVNEFAKEHGHKPGLLDDVIANARHPVVVLLDGVATSNLTSPKKVLEVLQDVELGNAPDTRSFSLVPMLTTDDVEGEVGSRIVAKFPDCDGLEEALLEAVLEEDGRRRAQKARADLSPEKVALYEKLNACPIDDLGVVDAFITAYGDIFRYHHKLKQWFRWEGNRWVVDHGRTHHDKMIAAISMLGAATNIMPSRDDATERWAQALRYRSHHRLKAVIEEAKDHEPVKWGGDVELDSNLWSLCTPDGLLDLHTGDVEAGRKDQPITLQTKVSFDPNAGEPESFLRFLRSALRGAECEELVALLRRCLAVALTGDTGFTDLLPIIIGPGGSGKGTAVGTLCRAIGDYAGAVDFGCFYRGKGGDARKEDAAVRVRNKRVVVSSESGGSSEIDVEFVKRISGGDVLDGKGMYQPTYEYVARYRLLWVTNRMPSVHDPSGAFYRRAVMMQFAERDGPEDTTLRKRLMEDTEEQTKVFSWIVRDCVALSDQIGKGVSKRDDLLPLPPSVRCLVEQYRLLGDPIGRWLQEYCDLGESFKTAKKILHGWYRRGREEDKLDLRMSEFMSTSRCFATEGLPTVGVGHLRKSR